MKPIWKNCLILVCTTQYAERTFNKIENTFIGTLTGGKSMHQGFMTYSHRESRLRNVEVLKVSGKNIFWTTLTAKTEGRKFFEFLHCPFEGQADIHQ